MTEASLEELAATSKSTRRAIRSSRKDLPVVTLVPKGFEGLLQSDSSLVPAQVSNHVCVCVFVGGWVVVFRRHCACSALCRFVSRIQAAEVQFAVNNHVYFPMLL